jgi:hypothetical protein
MELLMIILIILTCASPIAFIIGLIMCIFSSERVNKNIGVKLLVFSAISFTIGIGGCLMAINSSGFH